MPLNENLAEFVNARLEKGYSQRELAEMWGLSTAAIGKFSRGEVESLRPSSLEKIATVEGMTVDELRRRLYDDDLPEGMDIPFSSLLSRVEKSSPVEATAILIRAIKNLMNADFNPSAASTNKCELVSGLLVDSLKKNPTVQGIKWERVKEIAKGTDYISESELEAIARHAEWPLIRLREACELTGCPIVPDSRVPSR